MIARWLMPPGHEAVPEPARSRRARPGVLAPQGLDGLAAGRAVHAPRLPRPWLPGGQGSADPGPGPVGEDRPLGQVPRQHVRDRVGEARLCLEADELPGPYPDLQAGHQELPRPAAALRRVRPVPPQRALGRPARHHARARLHPGRRPYLLHRGPDPGRVRHLHPGAQEGLRRLRLHRHPVQGLDPSGGAHRLRRAVGQGRAGADGQPAPFGLRVRDLAGRWRLLRSRRSSTR